jgi:hypothetical protein
MSVPLLFPHQGSCRWKGQDHTDAAKRISDATYLHKAAVGIESAGKFLTCRMDTGQCDPVLYPTHFDAVRMHPNDHERRVYIRLRHEGMSVCEAEIFLFIARQAYDNGFRLTDPDSRKNNRALIPRIAPEHQIKILKGLRGR